MDPTDPSRHDTIENFHTDVNALAVRQLVEGPPARLLRDGPGEGEVAEADKGAAKA